MSLTERLSAGPPRVRPGTRCAIERLLDSLDGEERAAVETALRRDSGWSHAELARVLKAEGHEISQHTVGAHRNGQCGCSRGDDTRPAR